MSWDEVNETLQALALSRGHWTGYPVPHDQHPLSVCRGFPYPEIENIGQSDEDNLRETYADLTLVNQWFSLTLGRMVYVTREGGKPRGLSTLMPHTDRLDMAIGSAFVASQFNIETEMAALQKLATLVPAHAFASYFVGGAFVETSKRSGVTYVFRKLRPTLALSGRSGRLKALAALCLHPLAYYQGTHCGAMTPTDDVIAHLLLMRGDEHLFWKRSNQHPVWMPQSGV